MVMKMGTMRFCVGAHLVQRRGHDAKVVGQTSGQNV